MQVTATLMTRAIMIMNLMTTTTLKKETLLHVPQPPTKLQVSVLYFFLFY